MRVYAERVNDCAKVAPTPSFWFNTHTPLQFMAYLVPAFSWLLALILIRIHTGAVCAEHPRNLESRLKPNSFSARHVQISRLDLSFPAEHLRSIESAENACS